MINNKKKYGHVGRPSNEEVRQFKKKKMMKNIIISVSLVFVVVLSFLYFNREAFNLESVMGDSTAKSRIMTYKNSDNTISYVVSCPIGYKLRYNYGNSSVKKVETREYYCQKTNNSKKIKDATILKIPVYIQNEYRNIPSRCGGGNLNEKGCLPTVGAMVFSALLDKNISPVDINSDAYGYSNICSSNSYRADFLENYARSNGLTIETYSGNTSSNRTNISKKLKTANCIGVAALEKSASCSSSLKNTLCYSGFGHFVMFYANSDSSTDVYVNDPALKSGIKYVGKSYKLSDIISSSQHDKVRLFCRED